MSDKHITDFLPAVTLGEGDEFHIAQTGVDKKLAYGVLFNAVTEGLAEAIEEAEELVEEANIASNAAIAAQGVVNGVLLSVEDIFSQVQDIEDNVNTSQLEAADSATMAELWASAPENVVVEDDKYSSYHYMKKTEALHIQVEDSEQTVASAADEVLQITQNMPTFTVASTLPVGTPQNGDIWIVVEP